MIPLAHEKCIFPKRKRRPLEDFGIKSNFRKTNTKPMPSTVVAQAVPQSIIIEVPNQNSFEIQTKNNVNNNITQLPVVSKISSEVKDTHDTPDDKLKPPKNKSMSTPRRRSTHIRCLDFSTPQPKNIRDQARSKLFCDTPKRFEKVLEEPEPSPLPKLQADWGSINGFESMVNKETSKHWDTDIREMVGAGILTSDADGRKTRKKKTPRKKIKSINDKNNSEVVLKEDELNNLMQTNESQSNTETNKSNTSKNICVLNEQNYNKSLLDDKKLSKKQSEISISLETLDKVPESYFKEPLDKSLNKQDSLKTPNELIVLLETPDRIIELCNEQQIKFNSLTKLIDKKHGEFPIALETPDKITELCNEQQIKSNSLTNFIDKKHGEFPIALETPDKITELCNKQSIESNSMKDVNDKKHSEFSMSLETPDKIAELCIKQSIKKSDTKTLNDKKLLQKHSEFPILLENTDKMSESCNKQTTIESNSVKISCQTLNKLEMSDTNINEQENNLNQLNTLTTESTVIKSTITSNSKSVLEITNNSKEKDSNFLETFNNHNYLNPLLIKQPENNLNKPTENVKQQISLDQIETSHLDKLNSPVKCGIDKIQPIKHLIETPFKCDDAAVDVPETPISKLIREYDPSKLITPLPCTPEHDEDSLTETPLTKVFRETSYLNRPPISPFPPTPGNSRSVDTLLVQSDQECSKISNNICNNVNGLKEFLTQTISKDKESPIQMKKVKSLKWKTKPKPLIKSKIKYELKDKIVEAKKKQVYESVKVELFGSEISSSSSADELEKTNQQLKPIVINIKQENKKSGFKRIPQKKSIQSSLVLVNGIENRPLDEFNTKISKSPIKPTIIPKKEDFLQETKNTSNIKNSKKSMVHFDDPAEEIVNMSTDSTLNQSKHVIMNKTQKKTVTNENPEQLIGLSRYLNKSVESNECNYIKKTKSKIIESEIKTSKLNNSNNLNNSGISKGDRSGEKISEIKPCFLNDDTKTYVMNNLQNKSSEKYLIDENKKSNNRKEKSAVLKKSIEPLNIVKPTFTYTKTSNQNSISTKPTNNTSLDRTSRSNSAVCSNNNSMNNTSCITVGYNDESNFQLRKTDVSLNNMEYLKIPKVYEIISEHGIHEVVHLHLSEAFTFLDIPSELNSIQQSTPVVSPLIKNNKTLYVTPEIVVNELVNDVLIPTTSTPKDNDERQIKEKQNRDRRSPSLWDDSNYNYSTNKYKDDRHRESNRWKNTGYRNNRYDKKYWSKSRYDDEWLQHDRRNHFYWNHHVKREFRDDSVRDKDRSKYKEDKRRYRDYNNYDDRKGRDFEESKRFSNPQRMLQNDIAKKATKRPVDRTDHNKIPAKVSKVEHQRLLKNVNVDDFLSVVHGQK